MKTPILFALALLLSALGSGCASISTEQLQAEAADAARYFAIAP